MLTLLPTHAEWHDVLARHAPQFLLLRSVPLPLAEFDGSVPVRVSFAFEDGRILVSGACFVREQSCVSLAICIFC